MPNDADLHTKLGLVFAHGKQMDAAEAAYSQAISLDPRHADAFAGLGSLHFENSRLADAEAAFTAALNLQPGHLHANNQLGMLRSASADFAGAESCYLRALDSDCSHSPTLNNLGALQLTTQRFGEARRSLERAIAANPNFADAHNNLGLVYLRMNQFDAAEIVFSQAIGLRPDHASAYLNLGVLQKDRSRFGEAEKNFRYALALDPESGNALAQAYYCARHRCDWSTLFADEERLLNLLKRGSSDIPPFIFLTTESAGTDSANSLQLAAGRQYSTNRYPQLPDRMRNTRLIQSADARLRVGYLSSDFHAHATMHLLRGVFSEHDRSKYAIHAYSYGPYEDAMTREVQNTCEVFRNLRDLSDEAAAQLIAEDGIDVLIDLKGYTHNNRLGICAFRPAPVIVSWLGYPGTLGNQQLADVIIGDAIVTPVAHAAHFSERIVRLPNCYQPNDRQRKVGAAPTRSAVGLPEDAFVFCCFNSAYKISPNVFGKWCQLLLEVPDSVLWLTTNSSEVVRNLRCAAGARGVDANRLIFAPFVPQTEHLARIQLADIALDTFPCGSHTTASDTLWAGVPLVTMIGPSFVSRVAASVLISVGLRELATETWDDYFSTAKQLALGPDALCAIKQKISMNRLTTPLFDTQQFTRDLEHLYGEIWGQYLLGGQSPK